MKRRAVGAAVALAGLVSTGQARAQAASDAAAAEALFNEAQKLATAGDYANACPKFAESLRLDTGIGVMLYLGDCYEHIGKTASAWAEFKEAEELAAKQADKRAAAAHRRAEALEPTLARLVVRVEPGTDVEGLELKRDETLVGRAQWGSPVPVDPGPHVIDVRAPGKKARQISVQVVAGGAPTVLSIPALEDETAAPAPLPEPQPPGADAPRAPGRTQRTTAYIVGGAGVVGWVIGAAFGFDTISKNNAAGSIGKCHPVSSQQDVCNSTGVGLLSAAKTSALVSDVAFGVGAAALAGGVVLYLTAPTASPSSPAVGIGPAGVLVTGSW